MRTLRLGPALLCAGIVVLAAALPARAATQVLRTNGLQVDGAIADTGPEGAEHCQEPERIPARTNALRLSLRATEGAGPVVHVQVAHLAQREDPHPFATGASAAGWHGDAVVVPLRHALRRAAVGTVCMQAPGVPMSILGSFRERTESRQTSGPVRIEYLRVGEPPAPSPLAALIALVAWLVGSLH